MLNKKVMQLEAKIEKSLDKKLGNKLEVVTSLAEKIKEHGKKSTDEKKRTPKFSKFRKKFDK